MFSISPRQLAAREAEVLQTLKLVKDDLVGQDLITLGRVKNLEISDEHAVSCTIDSPSPVLLQNQEWITQATDRIKALSWVTGANVALSHPTPRNIQATRSSSLANVGNIIAVSSCKGGVGKSTVAVNLAFALKKRGARVGILDADIYGPSLPTMISPPDVAIRKSTVNPHFVRPVEYQGVQCMSFGFVNSKAAPGAGGKCLKAYATRGSDAWGHGVQGHGYLTTLQSRYSIPHTFQLPMADAMNISVDTGSPLVLSDALPTVTAVYDDLATTVAQECVKLKHLARVAPELLFDKTRGMVLRFFSTDSAEEIVLSPVDLRARCRCAQCIEEFTGKQILDPTTIQEDIRPTAVQRKVYKMDVACTCADDVGLFMLKGNYAFAVVWSDGHSSSLYTFEHLRQLAKEVQDDAA
ncbi:hypothetical protein DYB31_003245 [Aphanomyces astaci]|uniref:Uncharacterized protein n=1 Tax=Aphanomyces astaci TaxID=112090 RepID=A0A397FUY8_APHAT|nr:hypothetical protein DYB31_003245 [Aphanomyces astaci]